MLDFALKSRAALDTFTSNKVMKLWKYEMDEEEWEIANQLRNVLKVCLSLTNLIQSNFSVIY